MIGPSKNLKSLGKKFLEEESKEPRHKDTLSKLKSLKGKKPLFGRMK